jgi:hypothetical protein
MTTEEMKLIYDGAKSLKEAAAKIGIAEYKLKEIRANLKWRKKYVQTKRPRHWGHSIYDSVTTSYEGEIVHV